MRRAGRRELSDAMAPEKWVPLHGGDPALWVLSVAGLRAILDFTLSVCGPIGKYRRNTRHTLSSKLRSERRYP